MAMQLAHWELRQAQEARRDKLLAMPLPERMRALTHRELGRQLRCAVGRQDSDASPHPAEVELARRRAERKQQVGLGWPAQP